MATEHFEANVQMTSESANVKSEWNQSMGNGGKTGRRQSGLKIPKSLVCKIQKMKQE
jgi:hypothetical protein